MASRRDLTVQTVERPLDSAVCGNSFTENKEAHQIKHTEEESYRTETCNKAFTLDNHLNRHEIVHAEEKSYDCDQTFTEKAATK